MPRFRSIDPEFWRQPQIASLPWFTRLLLLGLLSQADDHGRVPANPVQLQGTLFAFGRHPTVAAITEALKELATACEVHLYRGTDRRDYALLTGWKDAASWQYQVIQRPQAPRYPEQDGGFPPGVQPDVPRRPPRAQVPPPVPAPKAARKERSSHGR